MTRTGYSKHQQNQLKELVYQCSIARIPTYEIKSLAREKLNMEITDNWIQRIRRTIKHDSEKEYNHLLTDNFAFKYQIMKTMHELEEIKRRKWQIVNKKEHLTQEDLICLKCLSELEKSTTLIAQAYDALPGIDQFATTTDSYESSNSSAYVGSSGDDEIKYKTPIFDMEDVRERQRQRTPTKS